MVSVPILVVTVVAISVFGERALLEQAARPRRLSTGRRGWEGKGRPRPQDE